MNKEMPGASIQNQDRKVVVKAEGIRKTFRNTGESLEILKGIDLTVYSGEMIAIVGESGSGKSTMALAMMRMIKPPGRIEGGQVIVDGMELLTLSDETMLKARLSKIAYIPQGAMMALSLRLDGTLSCRLPGPESGNFQIGFRAASDGRHGC